MDDLRYSDADMLAVLASARVIAMVGASPRPERPSHGVLKFLLAEGFDVIPVNPGHAGGQIAGQTVYASLADIPRPVDMVDIFRSSDAAGAFADEAIAIGARSVWMQIGVRDDAAAARAAAAGLQVVMNRCPKIQIIRLKSAGLWPPQPH